MKRNKHLDSIIDQSTKASFKDGKLQEKEVQRLVSIFKRLPNIEAIYLTSGYLKSLKREIAKFTLVVESAIPLSNQQINEIKRNLSKDHTLTQVSQTLNAGLLGGIRARVADTVYDYSLTAKLAQLKEVIYG